MNEYYLFRFNPLDRGNLNQILDYRVSHSVPSEMFQSPRSGKFESNDENIDYEYSNALSFNPLDRGNLNQML